MAASTDAPRQPLAQQRRIADAVLQADDDGIRRRVARDRVRDLGRIGALDGDQHHAGVGKDLGIVGQRQLSDADMPLRAFEARQASAQGFRSPRSRADAPAARRGGRRLADMPPTKQPMLPAPATHDRLDPAIIACLRLTASSDSRLYRRRLAERARNAACSPCNRHTAPLCFARRGGHSAGDDNGLTRCTQRNAERSARPLALRARNPAAACRR